MSVSFRIGRPTLLVFTVVSLLAGVSGTARATTLDFDTIATPNCPSGVDVMPASYGGFTWSAAHLAVECDLDYLTNYGNSTGAPSASNAIYNQAGDLSADVTRATQFQFDGALFSGWAVGDLVDLTDGITATSVTVKGFLGAALVGTQTLTLAGADGTASSGYLLIAGIAGAIDRLEITTPGNFWLMDNFQFSEVDNPGPGPEPSPVPEPASLVLLGTGLAAAVARRRRKKPSN